MLEILENLPLIGRIIDGVGVVIIVVGVVLSSIIAIKDWLKGEVFDNS